MTDRPTRIDSHTLTPEPTRESKPETITVVLALNGLKEHAYVGGGCCAITAADAIEQELRSWPFVTRVTVDDTNSEVTLSVTKRDSDVDAIVEVLESMGYGATVQVPPQTTETPS